MTGEGGGPVDPAGLGPYLVPSRRHQVEEVIRGSRFITTVGRTPDEAAARAFVTEIRQEFADATHNCWAYVAGPPGSTARVGMSDDGEPHGTAGRPMLETLLHAPVGEVAAVATRYFGGTKLGRGGLGRAYAGGVKRALASLPTKQRVVRVPVRIEVGYEALDPLFRFLESVDGQREEETYGAAARLRVAVPPAALTELGRVVADLTSGEGRVTPLDD